MVNPEDARWSIGAFLLMVICMFAPGCPSEPEQQLDDDDLADDDAADDDVADDDAADDDAADDDATDDDDPWYPEQSSSVSECGGFEEQPDRASRDDEYCENEVIYWAYDPDDQSLWIQNSRIYLNCCGDREMTLAGIGPATYHVVELDAELGGDGRCACDCIIDFSVSAIGIPQEVITISIERIVTDWAEASGVVWTGEFDLSEGAGSIIVEELIYYMSNEWVREECLWRQGDE